MSRAWTRGRAVLVKESNEDTDDPGCAAIITPVTAVQLSYRTDTDLSRGHTPGDTVNLIGSSGILGAPSP